MHSLDFVQYGQTGSANTTSIDKGLFPFLITMHASSTKVYNKPRIILPLYLVVWPPFPDHFSSSPCRLQFKTSHCLPCHSVLYLNLLSSLLYGIHCWTSTWQWITTMGNGNGLTTGRHGCLRPQET